MHVPDVMATIGPTLEKIEDLRRAIEAGARWFRLPCGYRQRPHLENARAIRQASADCGVPVQLLMDLPSSRPRTGKMNELHLVPGDRVMFWDPELDAVPPTEADAAFVPLPHMRSFLEKLAAGHRLRFFDGRMEFVVEEVQERMVLARLTRGNLPLKSGNSIALPDTPSPFVPLVAEDRTLLDLFVKNGMAPDWIALSLVASAADVRTASVELKQRFPKVRVMAKMETAAAVQQCEALLAEADGLMVARGDLGPALEFVGMPEAQERLVRLAHRVGKTAVVATQILENFAESGAPQRAELSDLSLLARQSPNAIMLGKETVFSPRPVEAIAFARQVMAYEANRFAVAAGQIPRSLACVSEGPCTLAIEGPNGVGKSHLCRLLNERQGWAVIRGVPAAWEDSATKLRMIRDADWLASAMYFLSGAIESSREAQNQAAAKQVMDRSLWSTLAVHYAHDPKRLEQLLPLLELASGHLKAPGLTLVLEASPETCRQRIAGKSATEQAFDAAAPATVEFLAREREFYHWLAGQGPKVVFLETDGCDPETVYERALAILRESARC